MLTSEVGLSFPLLQVLSTFSKHLGGHQEAVFL